jgi:hypothetical protein
MCQLPVEPLIMLATGTRNADALRFTVANFGPKRAARRSTA